MLSFIATVTTERTKFKPGRGAWMNCHENNLPNSLLHGKISPHTSIWQSIGHAGVGTHIRNLVERQTFFCFSFCLFFHPSIPLWADGIAQTYFSVTEQEHQGNPSRHCQNNLSFWTDIRHTPRFPLLQNCGFNPRSFIFMSCQDWQFNYTVACNIDFLPSPCSRASWRAHLEKEEGKTPPDTGRRRWLWARERGLQFWKWVSSLCQLCHGHTAVEQAAGD